MTRSIVVALPTDYALASSPQRSNALRWYYTKGKPREGIQPNQHVSISWQNDMVSGRTTWWSD